MKVDTLYLLNISMVFDLFIYYLLQGKIALCPMPVPIYPIQSTMELSILFRRIIESLLWTAPVHH